MNIRYITLSKVKKHRFASISVVVLTAAVVLGSFPLNTVFAELTNSSPVANDVSSGGVDGGVSQLLKRETVANIPSLKIAVYYPLSHGQSSAGEELSLRYSHLGDQDFRKKCFMSAAVSSGPGNIVVTIEGEGSSTVYKVPISRMCENLRNASGNIRNNQIDDGGTGWTNNKLFADYAFPPTLKFDARAGYYRADVTVAYGDNVLQGGNMENNVNFIPIASGAGAKIGMLGGDDANKFGLRSAFVGLGAVDPVDVRAKTQFSLPCDIESDTFQVKLFDPDSGVFGNMWMWVSENGNPLPHNRYGLDGTVAGANATAELAVWDGSMQAWQVTGGSNQVSKVFANGADKGKRYRLHIRNDPTPGKAAPNGNVLSLFIPYDSQPADVDCNYKLVPNIQLNGTNQYTYYANLSVTGSVTKNGAGALYGSHEWESYSVKYRTTPNIDINNGPTPGFDACNQIPAADRITGCTRISTATNNYPSPTYQDMSYVSGVADPPGTNTCFFTRVKNPTESNTDNDAWAYSDMTCAVSGVMPKIQVLGGDVKVGGGIDTSLTYIVPDGTSYGSWGEYGLMSNGLNTNMASHSGLNGGGPNANAFKLTFANTGGTGNYGYFGGVAPPSYTPAQATINTCSLGDTTFPPGTKIVFVCSGSTFAINGNLRFQTNGYSSISQLPNVKIVADNIVVASGVTQVDPWLVARSSSGVFGAVSTCNQISGFIPFSGLNGGAYNGATLNSNVCNQRVKFNGPIIADQLYAYRTYDEVKGENAAETFNLRPDNFLSSYVGGGTPDRPIARTEMITELPPRF